MKKKIVIGALLLLCIFGAVKLIWFSNPSSQTANSAKPGQQSQDYAESETKLEKIDSSAPKLVNLGAALKKEIENARKNAKEKEGTFKKVRKGSYYMVEVIENKQMKKYILHASLDPTHFIFKDGEPILYRKAYVKSLNNDVVYSISSRR